MATPAEAISKLKSEMDASLKHHNEELVKLKTKAKPLCVNLDAAKVDAFAKDIEKIRVTLGTGIIDVQRLIESYKAELKKMQLAIMEIRKDHREFGGNLA